MKEYIEAVVRVYQALWSKSSVDVHQIADKLTAADNIARQELERIPKLESEIVWLKNNREIYSEVAVLKKKLEDQIKADTTLAQENAKLREEVSNMEYECRVLKHNFNLESERLTKLEDIIALRDAEIARLEDELDNASGANRFLYEKFDKARTEYSGQNELVASLQDELDKACRSISDGHVAYDRMLQQRNEMLDESLAEILHLKQEISSLYMEIEQLNSLKPSRKQRLADLEVRVAKLESRQ
jgi:chromosome segregation ATPase